MLKFKAIMLTVVEQNGRDTKAAILCRSFAAVCPGQKVCLGIVINWSWAVGVGRDDGQRSIGAHQLAVDHRINSDVWPIAVSGWLGDVVQED